MLNRKQALTVAGILIVVTVAIFLLSHQTPSETVVTYKAVKFSPKTDTQEPSPSPLDSQVDRATASANDATISSQTESEASVESPDVDEFFDDVFFSEILGETQTTASVNEASEAVAVSPHGFGAYPSVPADFPVAVNWADYEEDLPVYELMVRVQIQLWDQGYKVMGISEENGTMHPIIRGRVYVKWDATGTEVVEVTGHPADMSAYNVSQIEAGNIPAGLAVFDYDTDGIDPYNFLNL